MRRVDECGRDAAVARRTTSPVQSRTVAPSLPLSSGVSVLDQSRRYGVWVDEKLRQKCLDIADTLDMPPKRLRCVDWQGHGHDQGQRLAMRAYKLAPNPVANHRHPR